MNEQKILINVFKLIAINLYLSHFHDADEFLAQLGKREGDLLFFLFLYPFYVS